MNFSKTKTSYYRRLYVAYLIDIGVNTVPLIIDKTGMPKRTAQDTIIALAELDIICVFKGASKNGSYTIIDWAAIKRNWIKSHLRHVKNVLQYP